MPIAGISHIRSSRTLMGGPILHDPIGINLPLVIYQCSALLFIFFCHLYHCSATHSADKNETQLSYISSCALSNDPFLRVIASIIIYNPTPYTPSYHLVDYCRVLPISVLTILTSNGNFRPRRRGSNFILSPCVFATSGGIRVAIKCIVILCMSPPLRSSCAYSFCSNR